MVRFVLSVICLFSSVFAGELSLRKSDIRPMMEELFTYHVEYKDITPLLIKRSLRIYVEQFDFEKTYLLSSEVNPYFELPEGKIDAVLGDYRRDQFGAYETLNNQIQKGVARAQKIRKELEKGIVSGKIDLATLPAEESTYYATTEEQLKTRIKKLLVGFLVAEFAGDPSQMTPAVKEKIFTLLERRLARFEGSYLSGKRAEHYFTLHLLKALAKSLDAHTSFFSAEEALEMRASLEKQFEGIGVILKEGVEGVVISGFIQGGPAERCGKLVAGDLLINIDGKNVIGNSYEEILEKMKGSGSSAIRLGVKRANPEGKNHTVEVELTRERILMQEERVTYTDEPFGDGIIGKISLPSFYESGSDSSAEIDMKEAIKALKKRGKLIGLVIDMRENSGGFLNQAVKVAGLFITNGVVVISKYSHGEAQYLRNIDGREYFNGPILILTSKASASAAEIVAQALQDYGTALIVGDERTYGKGTIQYQTVTDEDAKAFFKVTVGRYYTVSGRSTQIEGVKADIVVPTLYSGINIGERFLEYPLTNDQIPSAYVDPLTDVDEQSRAWLQRNYLPRLQKKISVWNLMLTNLRANSTYRLGHDPNNKLFLDRLSKCKGTLPVPATAKENWGVQDLQMTEAVQILKDMIVTQK
jgi:carboxyl-terminal processing protease